MCATDNCLRGCKDIKKNLYLLYIQTDTTICIHVIKMKQKQLLTVTKREWEGVFTPLLSMCTFTFM